MSLNEPHSGSFLGELPCRVEDFNCEEMDTGQKACYGSMLKHWESEERHLINGNVSKDLENDPSALGGGDIGGMCKDLSNGNMLRKEACMENSQIMLGFIG